MRPYPTPSEKGTDMKSFISTKLILAIAMTRLAYNEYRGWELPTNENGADEGYLVEYTDGGEPNDERHKGYISWSPKAQLEAAGVEFADVSHLLPYQQRVVAEHARVANDVTKLAAYLRSPAGENIAPEEFADMVAQHWHMDEYAKILERRASRFPAPPVEALPEPAAPEGDQQ